MLALVTDSTCGLTKVEAQELGVEMVPVVYVVDGTRREEGFVGQNGEYARDLLACRRAETEAAHPSAFERVFRACRARGEDVLCLTISSRLSGTFRSAEEAARAVDPTGEHVCVVDSWATAGALEFLVRRAHAFVEGGATLAEVARALTEARADQRILFTVPDVRVLHRSGRLGAFSRAVMSKLNRYPVMELSEGAIVEVGQGRGAHGMARALVSEVPAGAREFVLSHFGPRGSEAREVFLAVRKRFPDARIRVKDGGPVLAQNLGMGSVGLSWA